MNVRVRNMVKPDTGKVREALKDHGVSMKEMSLQLGKNEAYISNVITKLGEIDATAYKLMCMYLGVDEKDLMPDPEPKQSDVQMLMNIYAKLTELSRQTDALVKDMESIKKDMKDTRVWSESVTEGVNVIRSKVNANTIQLEKLKEKLSD